MTRSILKQKAREVLCSNYWYGVLTVLIVIGINYGGNTFISKLFPTQIPYIYNIMDDIKYIIFYNTNNTILMNIFSIIFTIFVSLPLTVGLYHYFMQARNKNVSVANVFYSFTENKYLKIVGAMAWKMLFTFLWTLLFIIPGIIKSIAYSMTPFILSDNPNIGYRRALKLSIDMTRGYKGWIFVLGLSFIGWILLSILTLGIGLLFLKPYINATYAELYATLRNDALTRGICTPEELGGLSEINQ